MTYDSKRKINYQVLRILNFFFINANRLFFLLMRLLLFRTPIDYHDLKRLNLIMKINLDSSPIKRKLFFNEFIDLYNRLNKKIELTTNKSNYWTYKFIYNLMISRGLYSYALIFKCELTKFLIDNSLSNISKRLNNELFLMNLESIDFNLDTIFFERKPLDNYNTKLRNILFGRDTTIVNSSYRNYLSNKTLAVVGPTISNVKNGAEIDTFDIVIRPKHRSSFIQNNYDFLGFKTNISYYQFSKLEEFDYESIKGLTFAVNSIDILDSNKNYTIDNKIIGLGFSYDRLWSGYSTHLNKILFHLIFNHSNLKKIKLFNFNFYVKKSMLLYGYRDNQKINATEYSGKELNALWYQHSWHDILSNWSYTQKVVSKFHIQTTEEINELLSIDYSCFMNRLDKIYGFLRE